MQIVVGIALFLVILTLIIYKVNDRFEKKEFIIFLSIIVFTSFAFVFYEKSKEDFFPKLFKEKYEKDKKIQIESLNAELINNKVVSSKDKFIYNFTYFFKKDEKEFLCSMKNVEIHKIQNEYIFVNLDKIKEECIEK